MIIPNDYVIPGPEPGERPVSVRMGAWLDAHPRVALAIVALCVIAGGLVEAM